MSEIPEQTFIEKFGVLVIAGIAFLQPWIIVLWKRFFKPGKIGFFETGKLEIGFSSFTSTIGINGTLRGINKDLYISKIHLALTKNRDSSKHNFEWSIFRDTKLKLSGDKDIEFELPYGIMLSTKSPQRINIQFHDLAQQEAIRPTHDEMVRLWNVYLDDIFPIQERSNTPEDKSKIYHIYQEYSETADHVSAYARLNREFYWEESEYQLTMIIETSNPNRTYSYNFKFALTESECDRLRLNVINLMDYGCGQLRSDWYFAYPNYQ